MKAVEINIQNNLEHATYVWLASQDPANDPVAQFDEGKTVYILIANCISEDYSHVLSWRGTYLSGDIFVNYTR